MNSFKLLFLFVWIGTGSLYGQTSIKDADELFDRYEYARSSEIYLSNFKKLSSEQHQKLMYELFVTGNFQKHNELWEDFSSQKVDNYFYYQQGKVCMALDKCDEALVLFKKYQSLDDEYDVQVEIDNCKNRLAHATEKVDAVTGLEINTTKAEIAGSNSTYGLLTFREIGLDEKGKRIPGAEIDNAEAFIMRPFIVDQNGTSQVVEFENDKYEYASISSGIFLSETEMLLTVNYPIETEMDDMTPHLFTAEYDNLTHQLKSLDEWSATKKEGNSGEPTINESKNCIVFTWVKEGSDHTDLYQVTLNSGKWSDPEPIEALNTKFEDAFPLFSGDSMLYFSSNRLGGYGGLDIYSVPMSDLKKDSIRLLGNPVNSAADDFNYRPLKAYEAMLTSNRFGGKGDDDIYRVNYTIPEPPAVVVVEEVIVFEEYVAEWKDIALYFDFDAFELERTGVLDSLNTFLGLFDIANILLEGHTDSQGSASYNEKLSQQRADFVREELIKFGIRRDQIETIGKGETDPIVPCTNCTDEQHAENRRVLIKLVVSDNE